MRITSVRLHRFDVRRRYATQIAQEGGGARDVVEASPFLFLETNTDNGLTGWGEISDIDPPEMPDLEDWQQRVSEALVGRDPIDIVRHHADWLEMFPDAPGIGGPSLHRLTRAGLDMACYDLVSHATGMPICRILGGQWHHRIHISWVAFIRDGDPSTADLGEWPRYDPDSRAVMDLDDECGLLNDPRPEERRAWVGIVR